MKKEFVDFTTVREDYNIYDLKNGLRLRVKKTLVSLEKDLTQSPKEGKFAHRFGIRDISFVELNGEFDTSNLKEAKFDQVTEKDEIKELDFKVIRENINIYEMPNTFFLLKLKILKIFSTNKKDSSGIPIIRFLSDIILSTTEKNPDAKLIDHIEE